MTPDQDNPDERDLEKDTFDCGWDKSYMMNENDGETVENSFISLKCTEVGSN